MWLALLVLLVSGRVGAEEPSSLSATERTRLARAHFTAGRQHYDAAEYEEAIAEFETGYEFRPLPLFLFNIGLAAQYAGKPQKALESFRRFLESYPTASQREAVEQRIQELQAAVARTTPLLHPPADPAARPPLQERSLAVMPESAGPSVEPAFAQPPASPGPRPLWRRGWVWGVVAVGVAAAASAVALGVVYGGSQAYPTPTGGVIKWGN